MALPASAESTALTIYKLDSTRMGANVSRSRPRTPHPIRPTECGYEPLLGPGTRSGELFSGLTEGFENLLNTLGIIELDQVG